MRKNTFLFIVQTDTEECTVERGFDELDVSEFWGTGDVRDETEDAGTQYEVLKFCALQVSVCRSFQPTTCHFHNIAGLIGAW